MSMEMSGLLATLLKSKERLQAKLDWTTF